MRFLSLTLVGLLAACSSSKNDTNGGTDGPPASNGGGSSGAPQGPTPLAAPAIGMQLATTPIKVANGTEQYSCWSFKVPDGAPISLVGLDNQIPTKGVHHWAVFTNSDPIKEAGPYECATMGISWGLVSGGGIGTPGVKFPDGTSMNIPAGQHIIFQLHLLNATGADISVDPGYINLNGTTATGLQPVGLLIAGTLNIQIPAHQTDVTVTGGCKLTDPLPHIFSVFPHMHQLGKRISAAVQPAAGAGVTISDQQWGFADQKLYPVEGSAAAGDQIVVNCHYDNPGDQPVNFGLSTKDEMCINVLYYYPASKPSQYCGLE